MDAEGVYVEVKGLAEAKAALAALPNKLRVRAIRLALAAGARIVRDVARRAAPCLFLATPTRNPGTLQRAIAVRTSKVARRRGDVGVFVNVRPLKGKAIAQFKSSTGLGGGKNPNDPFYWRFVNFGTRKMAARNFLAAGARELPAALDKFSATLGPQIQRLNDKNAQP